MSSQLVIASPSEKYDKVSLIEPSSAGFVHLAAEVDRRHAFLPPSRAKRVLLEDCKRMCADIASAASVTEAMTFTVALVPPGRGEFRKQRPADRLSRFDLAILIETATPEEARALRAGPAFAELEARVRKDARFVHVVTAVNARRIGPVDHSRPGIFLFNYFVADDLDRNLAVWEYTAGWFEIETALDNSTLLLPDADSGSQHSVINHCRWDGFGDILPSLAFKPTFRSYVLANFRANGTAANPILYRLA